MLIGITPVMPGFLIMVCIKAWNMRAGKRYCHSDIMVHWCSLYVRYIVMQSCLSQLKLNKKTGGDIRLP